MSMNGSEAPERVFSRRATCGSAGVILVKGHLRSLQYAVQDRIDWDGALMETAVNGSKVSGAVFGTQVCLPAYLTGLGEQMEL